MRALCVCCRWVALKLGAPNPTLRTAVEEAGAAYPRMAPGKVVDATGRVSTGVDPLGVARGDRNARRD